jgi:putative NADH-flavin reductase
MKIALIGATGFIGVDLLREALLRGHSVTAICRDPSKLGTAPDVNAVAIDVLATDALADVLRGHDAIIAAYNPGNKPGVRGSASILAAAEASGVPRLLVVGGAGSLLLADGRRNVDSEFFSLEWRQSALGTAAVLDMLRSGAEIDWVMLSPARSIEAGAKRGGYRLGRDHLLEDDTHQSFITTGDYAAAMLDEAERPAHHRERFTLAY